VRGYRAGDVPQRPDVGAGTAAADAQVGELPEGEQPLMSRVSRLLPSGAAPKLVAADLNALAPVKDPDGRAAITADSLTVLLSQALRAGDDVRTFSHNSPGSHRMRSPAHPAATMPCRRCWTRC
jgi:hypothetical protein